MSADIGSVTTTRPVARSDPMTSICTSAPDSRRACIQPVSPATASHVVTAQPSSPIGVTTGSAVGVTADDGELETSTAGLAAASLTVELAAIGSASSGVMAMASSPIRSRLTAALVAISTQPVVDVGSWGGGPSSDGWRHPRS